MLKFQLNLTLTEGQEYYTGMWTRYISRRSINNICNCKAIILHGYDMNHKSYSSYHKDYKKLIKPLNFLKNFIQKRQSIITKICIHEEI